MKTFVLTWLCPKDSALNARACLFLICTAFCLFNGNYVEAQDILLVNPSLEGPPKEADVPAGWYRAEKSVDTHPGANCCNVNLPPSDGNTYIGAIANSVFAEAIGQKLATPLKAGHTYAISVDLAYSATYYNLSLCEGFFAVYGSNHRITKDELLVKSPGLSHNNWKRYNFTFTPATDYDYLLLGAYYDTACTNPYTDVLIDNISTSIREVPQLEINVRGTCKGNSNGIAVVNVKDGEAPAPYSYMWTPGNYTSARVTNLNSGTYEVTVTSSNGASTKASVKIEEYDLDVKAAITDIGCNGDNNARITLDAAGGKLPYMYSIDGGTVFQSSPAFNNLSADIYNVVVRDSFNCVVNIDNLLVKNPSPLFLESVITKSVSCSDVQNGKIIIDAIGGTPPYTYSITGYKSQQDSILGGLDAGQYHYRVTDSHDCLADGIATITKEWRDCAVFVPNAFSPNGDGINDIFRAKVNNDVHDFRMAVYGRWGQLIFESRNPDMGWDGTQKGIYQSGGSYMYVITYTDSKNQQRKEQGTVVLIK